MQLGERLIGKSVISASDGRVIGSVKELYLDRNLEYMTAIRLGGGGLFSRKFELITREDVVLFGVDVILVRDSGITQESDQVPALEQWLVRGDLKGRAVDTPGGTKIGTIGDVIFDGAGQIIGFRLSRVHVAGPLAEKQVISREVVLDPGNEDNILTIDLSQAERQDLSLAQVTRDIRAREEEPEPKYRVEPDEGPAAEPEPEPEREIQMPAD